MNTFVTIFKFKPKFLHFFAFVTRNSQKDFFKVINNREESMFHSFYLLCEDFQGLVSKLPLLYFFILTFLRLQEFGIIWWQGRLLKTHLFHTISNSAFGTSCIRYQMTYLFLHSHRRYHTLKNRIWRRLFFIKTGEKLYPVTPYKS